MKLSATHCTIYRYDFPVFLEPHIFRLQPRMSSTQRLLAFEMEISPKPAGTSECLDQDGNLALKAWFDASTSELRVVSKFTVEMLRQNPFDYLLAGESLNLPLCYPHPLSDALTAYRNAVGVSESVKNLATAVAAGVEGKTLAFLLALSRKIFELCRQIVRPEGAPWPPEQTLGRQEGSCRDLAIGYEYASANRSDSYMHAWAEVYLPGIGWRGFDPARGLAVSDGHVAVAAGFDYDLASPVAGWYSGGSSSRMEASLFLQVDDAVPVCS